MDSEPSIAELLAEVARLRRQEALMDGEVQLLIQAERRSDEVERNLERQMRRLERLNAFAVAVAGVQGATGLLSEWVLMVCGAFALPMVVAMAFGDDGTATAIVHRDGEELMGKTLNIWEFFYNMTDFPAERAVFTNVDADTAGLLDAFDEVDPPGELGPRREAKVNIILPVTRENGSLCGLLIATYPRDRPTGFHTVLPSVDDEDFLRIVCANVGAAFKSMHLNRALEESRYELEQRVNERTQQLTQVNFKLEDSLKRLQDTQSELIEASRLAGMSDVATGVLHNVGNVLNSVNVSATIVTDKVREMLVNRLNPLAKLLGDESVSLDDAERRAQLVLYVCKLSERLEQQRADLVKETDLLARNVGHIRTIVSTQQSFAKAAGVTEVCTLDELVGDAVTLNREAIRRHAVGLDVVVGPVLANNCVRVDRHKVLQILVNLISNAVQAIVAHPESARKLQIVSRVDEHGLVMEVRDDGVGISAHNLSRVFAQGFTTRKDGHGFGLHSSACAARELGGELSCDSDGHGMGATFCLHLPMQVLVAA